MRPALLPLALLALALPAAAAGPPATFEVVNDTGALIDELYVDPVTAEAGDGKLVAGQVLPAGSWIEIPLDARAGCLYDIEARGVGGTARRAVKVDVCANASFRLSSARVMAAAPKPTASPGSSPSAAEPILEPAGPGVAPPLDRGLPICPGDPRCKRK